MPDEGSSVPWASKDMAMAGVWALVLMVAGVGLSGLLAWLLGEPSDEMGTRLWVSLVFLLEALLLIPAWRWGPGKYGGGWRILGLRAARAWPSLLLGALGFGAIMAVNGVWSVVQNSFDISGQPDLLPIFGGGYAGLTQALILGSVVAPIAEEVFFRGYLYAGLRSSLGHWQGLVSSSLIFALIHFTPGVIIPIFLMGVIFAWLYDRTDSLWPCIALHGLVNALSLIGAFLMEQGVL